MPEEAVDPLDGMHDRWQRVPFGEVRQLWEKYEDVAMHFNGLLIQLRLRALAGVTGIVTIGGLVARFSTMGTFEWQLLSSLCVVVLLAWSSVALLDIFYYNRLLYASVRALTHLESETGGRIQLSTIIEKEFRDWEENWLRPLFYVPVFLVLAFSACFSWSQSVAVDPAAQAPQVETPNPVGGPSGGPEPSAEPSAGSSAPTTPAGPPAVKVPDETRVPSEPAERPTGAGDQAGEQSVPSPG